jgi:hypothetical protein
MSEDQKMLARWMFIGTALMVGSIGYHFGVAAGAFTLGGLILILCVLGGK